MTELLDNPVWSSLCGVHRPFSLSAGGALRYPGEVCSFTAVRELNDDCFRDLAMLVVPGETIGLVHTGPLPRIPPFNVQRQVRVDQMVCAQPVPAPAEIPEPVSPDDWQQALELATLTKPGPFGPRTLEMGIYGGFRQEGRLVAMGGERLHPHGYTEVSGICTHPDFRGRGYAQTVLRWLCSLIQARNELPFLHVVVGSASEEGAKALYERLGFRVRKTLFYTALDAT